MDNLASYYGGATPPEKRRGEVPRSLARCPKYEAETYPTQRARRGVKADVENSFATPRGGVDVDKRDAAILLRHPEDPPKIRDLLRWRPRRDERERLGEAP